MSRTDVHRPYWVQLQDPYNRHRLYRFQMYGPQKPVLVTIYHTCGCQMCSGQYWNRDERRRSRHQWQRERQDLLKDQNSTCPRGQNSDGPGG